MAQTTVSEDVHARMDRLEQQIRQIRMLDSLVTWDDSDGIPVASLPAEFRMSEIDKLTNISRRELDALRHGYDESVASFISRWREKIVQVIDRPTEREQIQMVVRRLQHKIAGHDVIDRGSISLDQLGVNSDPMIAHSTHVVTVSIPSIDHVDDDGVQMMKSKDTESEPIILDERSHGGY
uniref:Uncharacterized protein n=1 Tax=Vitis vinifera TaxID=29760 RepID=A5AZQ3_VITVI|nr:hypothetical protein VITISV_038466 [Vitis vinifera]